MFLLPDVVRKQPILLCWHAPNADPGREAAPVLPVLSGRDQV